MSQPETTALTIPASTKGALELLSRQIGKISKMQGVLRVVDRYALVIESAVRNADPGNHAGVVAALQQVREALNGRE